MSAPDQIDLFGAASTGLSETSPEGAEHPPAMVAEIGDDINFSYHEASSGLWIVSATHVPTGRVARTTVGSIPVDLLSLEKIAKSARRAV